MVHSWEFIGAGCGSQLPTGLLGSNRSCKRDRVVARLGVSSPECFSKAAKAVDATPVKALSSETGQMILES